MIKTINYGSDFVLDNLYIKDGNGQITENYDELTIRLGTASTPTLSWAVFPKSRYSDHKIYVDAKDVKPLRSGQLKVKINATIPNTNYADGTQDIEYTEALDYYYNYDGAEVDETFIETVTSQISVIQNKLINKANIDHTHSMSDITGLSLKTINGNSLIGNGNIVISGEGGESYDDSSVTAAISNLRTTKADKTDIPSVDGFETTAHAAQTYQPKGTYLTAHQDISGKANASDVYTKTESDAKYQPKGTYLTEHQSLSEYAKKTEIPSVPSLDGYATQSWVEGKGYLTEHQSLTEYAKKTELPSVEGLETAAHAAQTYQPKGEYLTSHQTLKTINGQTIVGEGNITIQSEGGSTDLSGYYTKTEIDEKGYLTEHQDISGKANTSDIPTHTSQLYNDSGYLTEHQSLADYALKSEIPTIPSHDEFETKTHAEATYQPKGEYLTSHQDLSAYALKSELPTVPTKTSDLTNDSGYLTSHQSLSNYYTKSEVDGVVEAITTLDIQIVEALPTENISTSTFYLKLSETEAENNIYDEFLYVGGKWEIVGSTKVDLSDYYTKEEIEAKAYLTEHQSLSAYALKSELPTVPSLDGYATESWVESKGYLTEHQSLEGKADKEHTHSQYLTEHQSLADYALKSEIPSVEGFETTTHAEATYQPKGEYLTSHQSLEAYALKSELPTVPTKTSDLTNDSGYLTSHQDLSDYALKSEIPSVDGLISESDADSKYQVKGEYLTSHQSLKTINGQSLIGDGNITISGGSETDLSGYYTKSEIDSTVSTINNAITKKVNDSQDWFEDFVTDNYQPKGTYLTEHQSLKTINGQSIVGDGNITIEGGTETDLSGYYTKSEIDGKNYLTSHQSLEAYALKTEIPTIPTIPSKTSDLTNDSGYKTEIIKDITQSAYDALTEYEDVLYNITDATSANASDYYTKTQIDAMFAALNEV